jgi:hypothetical protein
MKESSMLAIVEGATVRMGRSAMFALALLVLIVGGQTNACAAAAKAFASPEEAVRALMAAVKADDSRELTAILGSDGKSILDSGDAVADKEGRQRFARFYEEASKLESASESKIVMSVGKDAWPFPIPIVKDSAGWRFDTKAGKEEILNRRIGRNELSTMQAALAYVDAQREYYLRNPQGGKLLHYAERFVSIEGRRDGLYSKT